MKRVLRFTIIAETDLDDAAIRNLSGAFCQDVTTGCGGRLIVGVASVPEAEAQTLWAKTGLGEQPKPGAKTWQPTRAKRN